MDAAALSRLAQAVGFAAAGLGLGLLYFGGLWLTLRRLPTARHPQWLFAGSFFGRTLVCVALLYWLAGGAWQNLVLMLAGFVVARSVLTWRVGSGPRAARPARRVRTSE